MKKIFTIAVLLLSTLSCMKEIEFKGDYDGEKLVLYSFPTTDCNVTARLYRSTFFLSKEYSHYGIPVKGARVWVEVNGTARYECSEFRDTSETDLILYVSEYIPKHGDKIKVSASYKNYPEVWGETVVPESPNFEVANLTSTEGEHSYTRINFSLTIKDNASECNYYRIRALMKNRWSEEEDFFWMQEQLYSNDIIFYKADISSIAESIDGDDPAIPDYFDDGAFNGSDHCFSMWLNWYKYFEGSGHDETRFIVDNLSEELYRYCVSLSEYDNQSELGEYFGEPVCIFNNINNGIGCVGAYSSGEISVD